MSAYQCGCVANLFPVIGAYFERTWEVVIMCNPECYICGEEIKEGDKYYNLKIFVCGCPVEVNLCKDCMEDCEEEN